MPLSISPWAHQSSWHCHESRYAFCACIRNISLKPQQTVVVGALSSVIFTIIVLFSSYITTYFMGVFEDPSWSSNSYFYSYYYISPWDVGKDLIRAALRILKDENSFAFDEEALFTRSTAKVNAPPFVARAPPGILKRFLKRFILGLPVVGAGSLVQMLLSLPFLGPVHWLARYRGNRSRRGDTRDVAAMVVIMLLLVGAARYIYTYMFILISRV